MKYVFKQIDDISGSNAVTTVEFSADYVGDILEQFQMFIRGCGFYVDGTLDFISEDEPEWHTEEFKTPQFDFSNIPQNNWPFGEVTK